MTRKQLLVVIGNGMAGARLVEEVLARHGKELFEIVVFGEEPYGNYNRVLLSNVLAGIHAPDDIFINSLSWYQENGVKLYASTRVSAIDQKAKLVYASGNIQQPYDTLVIATGSAPYVPPLENLSDGQGRLMPGVQVFRTMDDCDGIIKYTAHAKKAAVIGGGLLGLEAAHGLLNRGLEVHVVHVEPYLMNAQLDFSASIILRATLEHMGIHFHLEKRTIALLGEGQVSYLAFEDGSTLNCDMVVIATGVRPNIDLIREAGFAVDYGILVNDDLSCGSSDVYAIGECAQHRGRTYGLVAPIWEQAEILAERLTNATSRRVYQGSRVSTKLKIMDVELVVMGEKEPDREDDEVVIYTEPSRGIYKKLIIRDKRLVGAIVLGDELIAPRLLRIFDRGEVLPENRAELLFPLLIQSKAFNIADLPDNTQICRCNGVSKGKLLAAMEAGKRSLERLSEATHAGTGCGSCRFQVQVLLEEFDSGMMIDNPLQIPSSACTH